MRSQRVETKGVELQDWLVHMQADVGVEFVYQDGVVVLPGSKARRWAFGNQLIPYDTSPPRIIPNNDKLACQIDIAEPDLVLG